jgi:hypothetical protein
MRLKYGVNLWDVLKDEWKGLKRNSSWRNLANTPKLLWMKLRIIVIIFNKVKCFRIFQNAKQDEALEYPNFICKLIEYGLINLQYMKKTFLRMQICLYYVDANQRYVWEGHSQVISTYLHFCMGNEFCQ